mmetsp:Transcript_15784/g.40232  ORF Transcript_15784/g.40232 Transcript_15784/m.40232 type:complete len:242 (+) Transcript_15784:961-1686(+)
MPSCEALRAGLRAGVSNEDASAAEARRSRRPPVPLPLPADSARILPFSSVSGAKVHPAASRRSKSLTSLQCIASRVLASRCSVSKRGPALTGRPVSAAAACARAARLAPASFAEAACTLGAKEHSRSCLSSCDCSSASIASSSPAAAIASRSASAARRSACIEGLSSRSLALSPSASASARECSSMHGAKVCSTLWLCANGSKEPSEAAPLSRPPRPPMEEEVGVAARRSTRWALLRRTLA